MMTSPSRPNSAARLRLRSRSKSAASAGLARLGARPAPPPASSRHRSSKYIRTSPSELSSIEHRETNVRAARRVDRRRDRAASRPRVVQPAKRRAVDLRPSSPAVAWTAAASAHAVITSTARVKPACASTCPDGCSSSASRARASSTKRASGASTHGFDRGDDHASASSALSSSTRINPDVRRRLGDDDDHEIAPPARGADPSALGVELQKRDRAEPRRARRQPRLAIERRRERGDAIAVLPEPQVRVDDEPVALGDDQARPHATLPRERLEDGREATCSSRARRSRSQLGGALGAPVEQAAQQPERRRARRGHDEQTRRRRRRHRDDRGLRLEHDRLPVADVEVARRAHALRPRCRSAARRPPAPRRCRPVEIQRRRARSRSRRAAAPSAASSSEQVGEEPLRIGRGALGRRAASRGGGRPTRRDDRRTVSQRRVSTSSRRSPRAAAP